MNHITQTATTSRALSAPVGTRHLPVPAPRVSIATRLATMADLPFLDAMHVPTTLRGPAGRYSSMRRAALRIGANSIYFSS